MAAEETPEQRQEAICQSARFIVRNLRDLETDEGAQKVMRDLDVAYRQRHPDTKIRFLERMQSLRALCQPLCDNPDNRAGSGERIFRQSLALVEAWENLTYCDPRYSRRLETQRHIQAYRDVPTPENMVDMVYSIRQDMAPGQADPLKDTVSCLARLCKRWVQMAEEEKGRAGPRP